MPSGTATFGGIHSKTGRTIAKIPPHTNLPRIDSRGLGAFKIADYVWCLVKSVSNQYPAAIPFFLESLAAYRIPLAFLTPFITAATRSNGSTVTL